jgi:hypothetical protein
MSYAYDLVRDAVRGTALEPQLDTIAMRLHLTSDSPDWIIAAVAAIAVRSTREATDALEARIAGAIANAIQAELSAQWRDSLGAAIAGAVVASAATKIAEPTQKAVADVTTSAKQYIAVCDERTQRLLLWRMPGQALLIAALVAVIAAAVAIMGAYRVGQHNSPSAYLAGEQYAVLAEQRCESAYHHLCNGKGK